MKQKKSIKKYAIQSTFTETLSHQAHLSDIKQQLRHTIEQLEQYKLTNQLQCQKRMIAQQQYQILKQENGELKNQLQQARKQMNKFIKKYAKIKQQRYCQRCKNQQQSLNNNNNNKIGDKIQRQRQIFIKQRTVLKNQINQLKMYIESLAHSQQSKNINNIHNNVETLRKQSELKTKTIQDQKKIIKYLDQKLSNFQLEKLQTLSYVEQVDQKLQELQMENLILKGIGNNKDRDRERERDRENSPVRKNGSIKYLQKSRSRVSKLSPTRY